MKRLDFSIKEGRLEYHHECEERMTAEQKYRLALAAIVGATLTALVYMVGWAALVGAVAALMLYGAGMLMKD